MKKQPSTLPPMNRKALQGEMTIDSYADASLGYNYTGVDGEKPWPFNYQLAVDQIRSMRYGVGTWVYRALMLNAERMAGTRLRLYVREKSTSGLKRKAWNTRRIDKKRRDYLMGDGSTQPSRNVMTKAFDLGDDMVEVDPSHPVLQVLKSANRQLNGFDLLTFVGLMESLTGRGHLFPIMDQTLDRPVELWPMPSQWVHLIPSDGSDGRLISGVLYGEDRHQAASFDYDEILTFARPYVTDLIYPIGDVEAMWGTLGRYVSRRTQEKSFFDNSARPSAVVSIEGADTKIVTQTQARFNALHRGAANAGKVFFTNGKTSFAPLGYAPKDLGDYNEIIEEIVITTGVPRDKLLGNSTYANSETADGNWLRDRIAPGLRRWEDALNSEYGYLSLFGSGALLEDAVLCFDNVVPEDETGKHTRGLASVAAGAMTYDEFRLEVENREPYEDGSGSIPRVNGVPLDQVGMPAPAAEDPFVSLFKSKMFNPEPVKAADAPVVNVNIENKTPASNGHQCCPNHASHAGYASQKEHIKSIEGRKTYQLEDWPVETKQWRIKAEALPGDVVDAVDGSAREDEEPGPALRIYQVVREAIEEQYNAYLTSGMGVKKKSETDEELPSENDIFEIIGSSSLLDKLRSALLPPMLAAASIGAEAGVSRVGIDASFDVYNESVTQVLEQNAAQIAEDLTRTTSQRIRSEIARGLEAGKGTAEIARDLVEAGRVQSARRAEMIARTESANAYGEGQDTVWRESDVVSGKKWLLAPGACPICQEIAKQVNSREPTPIDQPFFAKGQSINVDGRPYKFDYKDIVGPPAHPMCRCDVVPVLKDE